MFSIYKIFLNYLKEHSLKNVYWKTISIESVSGGGRCKETFEALKIIPDEENGIWGAVLRSTCVQHCG